MGGWRKATRSRGGPRSLDRFAAFLRWRRVGPSSSWASLRQISVDSTGDIYVLAVSTSPRPLITKLLADGTESWSHSINAVSPEGLALSEDGCVYVHAAPILVKYDTASLWGRRGAKRRNDDRAFAKRTEVVVAAVACGGSAATTPPTENMRMYEPGPFSPGAGH